MAPSTTGTAILNGVNYASGAAGILDSSGYAFVKLHSLTCLQQNTDLSPKFKPSFL
jgi:hypothetical protein